MESVIMPVLQTYASGADEPSRPLGGGRVRWRPVTARAISLDQVSRGCFRASFGSEKIACVVWTCVRVLKELVFSAVSAASSHSGQSERFLHVC